MPTKEWYLENYDHAEGMLGHASTNHGVSKSLAHIRYVNGQKEVKVFEAATPANFELGTANILKEAIAEALGKITA